MHFLTHPKLACFAVLTAVVSATPNPPHSNGPPCSATNHWQGHPPSNSGWSENPSPVSDYYVSLGPRPYYIINNMTEGPLRSKLESCENGPNNGTSPFTITDFSIGHRGGGTLQFPEETVESLMAGARMGAGILECDVSFTKDRGLVCRHSLCDLHTTTNILTIPALAAKCTTPFTPANATSPANALCCTSDITLVEFETLCGKEDGFNSSATNPQDYQRGAPNWRTELYDTCGTVMTLNSFITHVENLPGFRNFTPELKTPPAAVPMPFNGYTQEMYAQDFIDTFKNRSINPDRVWAQSFLLDDVLFWLKYDEAFGNHAIFLDERGDTSAGYATAIAGMADLKAQGINIISPQFPVLLTLSGENNSTIVPSSYANAAKAAGLDVIAWSFERSGPLARVAANDDYYYLSIAQDIHYDGQLYEVMDVLVNQVGIVGFFSDWSSTVTFFANCFGTKGPDASKYH